MSMLGITSGHNWGGSFISVVIEDDRPIRNIIRGLSEFEGNQALTEGLKKGAEVFRNKGKTNLRSRLSGNPSTGNLMGAFRVFAPARLLRAKAGFTSKGNHAHLVDLGTVRRHNRRMANRGVMPANHFWTDARRTEEDKAARAIFEGVQKAVQRIKDRAK